MECLFSFEYCNHSIEKMSKETQGPHVSFHFISYVGELWTYLHCYHTNGSNVNHGQWFLAAMSSSRSYDVTEYGRSFVYSKKIKTCNIPDNV